MTRVAAIAINTFRELVRDKVLYVILFFACALILSAWAIGQLSLHEDIRVTRDLGLGGISLFGVILAIFAGVTLVYKEIERKTLYAFIPKPIHRWQFVVGKFLGLVLTLGVQMGAMAVVLWIALVVQGSNLDGEMARALLLLHVQVVAITAVAVFFSTFSTPFLSGLFTLGIFVIGRSTPELRAFIASKFKDDPGMGRVLEAAMSILPDLHLFYVSGAMVHGKAVSVNPTPPHTYAEYVDWAYVASATGYGALYAGCVLALAVLVFSRRDFV